MNPPLVLVAPPNLPTERPDYLSVLVFIPGFALPGVPPMESVFLS